MARDQAIGKAVLDAAIRVHSEPVQGYWKVRMRLV